MLTEGEVYVDKLKMGHGGQVASDGLDYCIAAFQMRSIIITVSLQGRKAKSLAR